MNAAQLSINRRLLRIGLAVILFAVAGQVRVAAAADAEGFAHPGLLNTMAEFSFMREKVRAGEEPWRSGYARIPSFLGHTPQPVEVYRDGLGHRNDPHDVNMIRLCEDAQAAYGSALQKNQNNHTSQALLCRLAIAVYADDRPRFEKGDSRRLASVGAGFIQPDSSLQSLQSFGLEMQHRISSERRLERALLAAGCRFDGLADALDGLDPLDPKRAFGGG